MSVKGTVNNPFFVSSTGGIVDNPFGAISGQEPSPYNIRYILQSFADSVGVTDHTYDLLQISDADISLFSLSKFVNETLSASQGVVFGFNKNIVDPAVITDSLAYNLAMTLANTADAEDLIGVPDGITYQYGMTKADAASTGDVFARTVVYKRALAETLNTVDAPTFTTIKILTDSGGISDAPSLAIAKPFADGREAGDASIMSVGLSKLELLNAGELFTRIVSYNRDPGDLAQTASSPSLFFNKILADVVSASDSDGIFVGFQFDQTSGDLSQTTDASIITFGKNPNDTISAGESSTQVWTYNRSHADTSAAAESLVYNLAKTMVGDSASGADSLAYNMALTAGDDADATEALGILTTLRPSDGVDAEDLVGVPDGITYQITMTKADAASAGESFERTWTAYKPFGDTGDASDAPVKSARLVKSDSVTQSDAGQLFRLNYFESDYSVASFTAPYNFVETISLT